MRDKNGIINERRTALVRVAVAGAAGGGGGMY